jgi:hypothetical protein
MKSVIISLIFFVMLSAAVSAELETVRTVPYKIIFDIGLPHNTYILNVRDPKLKKSFRQ